MPSGLIEDVDLWFHTAHTMDGQPARMLFHRPQLCSSRRSQLMLSDLTALAHETLSVLRPHWWQTKDAFDIVWRPCELTRSSCGEPDVLIDGPAAALNVINRVKQGAEMLANLTRLNLVIRPGLTLAKATTMAARAGRAQTTSTKGWDALRSCGAASCAYRCPLTATYASYLAELPALHQGDLRLPAHSRVLAYGTSFLGQVVEGLVCAGGLVANFEAFEFPPAAPTHHQPPSQLQRNQQHFASPSAPARVPADAPVAAPALLYPCCDGGASSASPRARPGRLLRYTFENNASLTVVTNYAPLQESHLPRISPASPSFADIR